MPTRSGTPKSSAYKFYSEEDIAATEFGTFVVQVGDDLFQAPNGKMAFNKERAEMFYDDILGGLTAMRKEGTDVEKEDAQKCLLHLRIMPLRFH
jgi:hypothetical protein